MTEDIKTQAGQLPKPNPALKELAVFVGDWESSSDGEQWEHDFDLTYTRKNT